MNEKDYSLTELNRPKDWKRLTTMDKKHIPIVTAPKSVKANEPFELSIKIGGVDDVEHPNMLGHWINWVILYADIRPVAQIFFYPTVTNGYTAKIQVTLTSSSTLVAQAYCNLHGVWEGKGVKINVS
jgi:superoxide reductase